MRYLVTGAAGFIGSHLVESLVLDHGDDVVAVDAFTSYYDTAVKEDNARGVKESTGVSVVRRDLATEPVDDLVDGVDAILHLAGQPGVRLSWSEHFEQYVAGNLVTTQRLLESARRHGMPRFVLASSSSVYGNATAYPTDEESATHPFSPYGVTKLAAESLCSSYGENWGISTVALRYFTVYGPRQRPDMAFNRFIDCALRGEPAVVYGDGTQIRDFTYVGDIVAATVLAAHKPLPGARTVLNVAGGGAAQLNDVLAVIGQVCGRPLDLDYRESQAGDVRATGGTIRRAADLLGWQPATQLAEGLTAQVEWQRRRTGG